MQSGGSSGSRREKEPCNWKTCLRKKQVSAYGAPGVVLGAPGVVLGAPGVVLGAPGVVLGAPQVLVLRRCHR
jgi:hypothetical protein